MSDCRRCQERGQTWDGHPPKCAFRSGVFDSDNWMCATMAHVRLSRQANSVWNDDQNLAVYPFDCGRFLILGWYKSRGRTELAIVVDECEFRPARLDDVEAVLMPAHEGGGMMAAHLEKRGERGDGVMGCRGVYGG